MPESIEALLIAAGLVLPGFVASAVFRSAADLRPHSTTEGRIASVALWASLSGLVALVAWNDVVPAVVAMAGGTASGWQRALLVGVAGFAPAVALVLGLGVRRPRVREAMLSAGLLRPTATTPWDTLTSHRETAVRVYFSADGREYTGIVDRFGTDGDEMIVRDLAVRKLGAWVDLDTSGVWLSDLRGQALFFDEVTSVPDEGQNATEGTAKA